VIEYRKPSETPTKDGCYYARFDEEEDGNIEIVEVAFHRDAHVWRFGVTFPARLDQFTWFGSVREIQEG
jgi:hypothetical protein